MIQLMMIIQIIILQQKTVTLKRPSLVRLPVQVFIYIRCVSEVLIISPKLSSQCSTSISPELSSQCSISVNGVASQCLLLYNKGCPFNASIITRVVLSMFTTMQHEFSFQCLYYNESRPFHFLQMDKLISCSIKKPIKLVLYLMKDSYALSSVGDAQRDK